MGLRLLIAAIVGGWMVVAGSWCQAQEWTRFRGPNGSGIAENAAIPASWTENDYNWIAELPGVGHSSPVIWGERIFLTSATDEGAKRLVLCLSTVDGSLLWSREYDSTGHRKHLRNSFATPTPAVDDQHVYVVWGEPESYVLLALDHEGQEIWRRDFGPFVGGHGCGTSPIVYEDLVILGNDQDGESSLIAVDRQSGETRWQTPRKATRVSYSTPCVLERDGKTELIFNSQSHGISGIDPETGRTNWELEVFDKRTVNSPMVAAGLVFGSCGSGAGGNYVVALKPGDPDAHVEPQVAYKVDKSAPYVPTPVANGKLLFLISDNGVATCIDADSGKVHWQRRIGGNFSGSPIRIGDRLYAIADNGDVIVLSATDEYELLGRMPLGEECRTTPAVAGGVMYLRTVSHLYSIGRPTRDAAGQAGR